MPLVTISDVADKAFDYIVIGAGPAGLAAAARLSEDPSVSVALLEAGEPNLGDPKILLSAQYGATFGNPKYDWAFPTVPQKNALNLAVNWNRGRGLGGTSAMNFMCWVRPPAEDVDAFGELGNEGWNWDDYLKYSKLTECFHPAAPEHTALYPHTSNIAHHGTEGPLLVSTPHHVHTVDLLFKETCEAKGLKVLEDPYGGDISGMWMGSSTMDPKTWTRSNAATAFYEPNADRKNFTVLCEAHVSRILFADAKGKEDITATGVEFIHGGKTYTVNVKKEVILSAGALKSPHILELSGLGRPDVLEPLGIPVKVDLPGVGENMQEHTLANYTVELNGEHDTLDKLRDEGFSKEARRLHAEGKGLYRTGITSFAYFSLQTAAPDAAKSAVDAVAAEVEKRKPNAPSGLRKQWDLQLETLRNEGIPDMELAIVPMYMRASSPPENGKAYLTMELIQQHPFSRGHVHAKSTNPLDHPTIDPNLFDFDFDLESLVHQMQYTRSFNEVEPWKSASKELDPSPNATHEQLRDYIKGTAGPTWHAIGTCSMLPREDQGVVDAKLKVYGTTNLRIADISIVPLHVAAHTQATAYVIGEKVADFITGKSRV
ncbi:GMC oxidoreductase [Athelia psychrophila]|uniref:GMC oxidoreductase n=1 Tax=Athelia psychrophila TaxID=1759441 RepID=A0A166R6S0_9AGAM|nr:GMC oxidoreductase [Fibularhizoctonia sp. CBS 109695]